ncbi:MAG: pantetheine-phosphate adenylyltransferase [Eubacteriaceae bacterium]|nr:pantetheine-phosphate adenylyltransferase [Eubacteriaceae bacterium]
MGKSIYVYAGSFDPITIGHLDIINKVAGMCDTLVVAIGINAEKSYTYSLADRLEMIRDTLVDVGNVQIVGFEGDFLVTFAEQLGATHLVRGIRSRDDFSYELRMYSVNKKLCPQIETLYFFPSKPEYANISSSLVKSLVGPNGWEDLVADYVPGPVLKKLVDNFYKGLWTTLANNLGIQNHESVYQELLSAYENSEGASLGAIHQMLCQVSIIRSKLKAPDALVLAVWHYAHYKKLGDNEEAALKLFARLGIDGSAALAAAQLLGVLNGSVHTSGSEDFAYAKDISLAIFGTDKERFANHEKDVLGLFIGGGSQGEKADFLESLAASPRIYQTQFYYDRHEEQARANIKSMLDALDNKAQ